MIWTQDETRRQKAMKRAERNASDDAQNRGSFMMARISLSYSQDVDIRLTEYLKDVKSVVEENHMYIRIASK